MHRKRWFVLIVFFLFTLGCSREDQAITVDLEKKEQVTWKEEIDSISYAYLPQYSHTVSFERHHRLVEFLRRETGLNIKQIFPDTFDQHMTLVGQGKIDISFSNPFIYIKIVHRYGAKAFARIVEVSNQDKFKGQIISRSDNERVRTLSDCRGKRWIAVDSTSAGGYLYPLGHFLDHDIQKNDFKEIAFAPGPGGKQEKVVLSVHAGKYDIGTIREGTLDVVANKINIKEIRVISETDWYPGWVYAAGKNLDRETIEKIKQALVKLDFNTNEHQQILEAANFTKIIPSNDKEFNSIRQLAVKVGIGLGK